MKNKAERIRDSKVPSRPQDSSVDDRLPPGQMLTERFPILYEGEVPQYDMSTWDLRIFGEVEDEKSFNFADIENMPKSQLNCDIHCVTRWSKFDTKWDGVRFRDLLEKVKIKASAKYVMIHAEQDYDANIPLEDLMGDPIMLASHYNGQPLTPKHGYPLRLIVPHLYFWKSVKWIRGIEFLAEDRPGFWERNGFHNRADPFKEERFSGEDLPIPEDEWLEKEFD